jgi:hypothetical protein
MNIHQLQITYSAPEDRLILRINNKEEEEMRLFLTRKIVASFWDILAQSINHSNSQQPTLDDIKKPVVKATPEVQEMQQQMTHQDIINQSDYETPFSDGNKFPLGEPPILVEKITINVFENKMTTLIFSSGNRQDINLNLNQQSLHNLFDLITKVIPSTDWNIGLAGETNALISDAKNSLALH